MESSCHRCRRRIQFPGDAPGGLCWGCFATQRREDDAKKAKEARRDLCEQALAGIPDPVAFVAAAREVVRSFDEDDDCISKRALRRLKEVMG